MTKLKKLIPMLLSCVLVLSLAFPFGSVQVQAADKQISDILKTNANYQATKWAVDNNYMQVMGGNVFQPNAAVMEWQVVQFFAKLDKTYHLDVENRDILYSYYGELNLPIFGANNLVRRNANISRGDFARLYAAASGLDLSEIQAVQYLYMNELTTGTTGQRTYLDFRASRNLTRGELAAFMYRINQQGKIAIDGLASAPSGKDNNKITLPTNFAGRDDGTVSIPTVPGASTDDKTNRPEMYGAVKKIEIANEELTANGVDSSLISIELRDSYGNVIPYDESLQFRVTSQVGAKISTTSTGNRESTVYTDGPDLNVFITAPALSNTVVDTIRFEMVNPSDKYYTYRNQPIEVSIRYVPKPELRISYELFGPDQPEIKRDPVVPAARPLPMLPQGEIELESPAGVANGTILTIDGEVIELEKSTQRNVELEIKATPVAELFLDTVWSITVPFTPNDRITVDNYNPNSKTMTGSKREKYTRSDGLTRDGLAYSDNIQYGNADLKLEGQMISVGLFEQILQNLLTTNMGLGNVQVIYTVNNEGRATYDLQGAISKADVDLWQQYAVINYLTDRFLPSAEQITLAHEESVNVIKAMFDRLGENDKTSLRNQYPNVISKLEAAVAKLDELYKQEILKEHPPGTDKFTKVIVQVMAPGGQTLTDFNGTVDITFNGVTQRVRFDRGVAVVYFYELIYGKSQVKARIHDMDPRYNQVLSGLNGATASDSVYTNQRFEDNLCALDSEVIFVVDHSGSMNANDRGNITKDKVKQTIEQLQANPTHVYRFNTKTDFEAKDEAKIVAEMPNLLITKRSGGTNIISALNTALNRFSDSPNTSKAIVLVTDGKASNRGLTEMIKAAKEKGVVIHTVSVGSYQNINAKLLQDISSETNGTYQNISEIENLHGALQAIITTILCNTPVMNNSCLVGETIFTRTDVRFETQVTILADVNTGCGNIEGVRVIFNSPNGDLRYDLPARGSSRFMHRPNLYEFPEFDLYVEVEFQALDKAGNVIGTKIHTIKQTQPNSIY